MIEFLYDINTYIEEVYDDIKIDPETLNNLCCNRFSENKLIQEETYATYETRSMDDEITESNDKISIIEKPKNQNQIEFLEQKIIRDVNIIKDAIKQTPKEEEKSTQESNSFNSNQEQKALGQKRKYIFFETDRRQDTPTSRTDNLRREAFNVPLIFLRKFFKKHYKLNFKSLKCYKVLGISCRYMKSHLGLTIEEMLSYKEKNITNKKLKEKMSSSKRRTLIYFLNIKYEELFNRYISGNINFPIIENGTVRISEYITLEKEKEIKEREWRNIEDFKNNEELLQKRLKKFEKLSKNMIIALKDGKFERKKKKR
jgi:hypothetical protein